MFYFLKKQNRMFISTIITLTNIKSIKELPQKNNFSCPQCAYFYKSTYNFLSISINVWQTPPRYISPNEYIEI